MLRLYHGITSVCSIKARIGLAEMALPYDEVILDLQKGDQFAPDYRALNPAAVVPTLVDDGLVVTESSLIVEYLDRTYNDARLMPEGRALGVATRHWLLRCLAIHAAVNTLTFSTVNRTRALATKTPDEIEAALAKMPNPVAQAKRRDLFANGLASVHVAEALATFRAAFADMAATLSAHPWLSGPAFGLADIGVIAYVDRVERLGFEGLWHDTPAVGTWLAAMQARPSYQSEVAARIPATLAERQRTEGAAFWPELQTIWTA